MQLRSGFSLLNADYVQLGKNWNYKNVISPFYRLYLIDEGEAVLSNPKQQIKLEPGYLYLIPSFTIVNQVCRSFLSQYYIHFFEESQDGSSLFSAHRKIWQVRADDRSLESFKRILQINPGRDLRHSDNPKVYEQYPVLKSFRELNDQLPLSTLMETQGLILQLLSRFMEKIQFRFSDAMPLSSKIAAAINHIETHLSQPLSVEYLAEMANQNSDYFSRQFVQYTGSRPLQYIQHKRIERAQFLILSSDFTLSYIAQETGFESLSYFNRIFKKITGKTPGNYKDSQAHWI